MENDLHMHSNHRVPFIKYSNWSMISEKSTILSVTCELKITKDTTMNET